MFQNGALFSSLSVQENVEAPLIEHTRLREPWLEAVALMKIGLVGLDAEVGRQMPAELSGGMRKRDRKSTRLNSKSLMRISYAVFCLKKKKTSEQTQHLLTYQPQK